MKRSLTSALLFSAALLLPAAVNAQDKVDTVNQESVRQQAAEYLNIAERGNEALQDVRMARLAIFQGVPEHAVKLVDSAAALIKEDSTDWSKYVYTGKKPAANNDRYVVIDAAMGISENYIASPKKEAAIHEANEKLAKGDKSGAVQTLRLADIAVVKNIYLLPLAHSQKAIADARTLLDQHKYYEANLALKSVEDGVVIDGNAVIAE